MAIKKEVILSVDTKEAIDSVGALQTKVNELKGSISSLDESGTDLKSVVERLGGQMKELTTIMDNLKNGLDGVSKGITDSLNSFNKLDTEATTFQDKFKTEEAVQSLESLKAKIMELEATFTTLNGSGDKVKGVVKALEDQLKKLGTEAGSVKTNVEALSTGMKNVRTAIDALEKVAVNFQKLFDTTAAVKSLEELKGKIAELQSTLSSSNLSGEGLKTVLKELEEQATKLSNTISGVKSNMESFSKDLKEAQEAVTQLSAETTTFQEEFKTLSQEIRTNLEETTENVKNTGRLPRRQQKIQPKASKRIKKR